MYDIHVAEQGWKALRAEAGRARQLPSETDSGGRKASDADPRAVAATTGEAAARRKGATKVRAERMRCMAQSGRRAGQMLHDRQTRDDGEGDETRRDETRQWPRKAIARRLGCSQMVEGR